MIRVERDPDFINAIVNSPAVRPFVDYSGREGPIDVSPIVGSPTRTGIVWLSNQEDAVAAFPQTGDREYQIHLFFGETCRGRKALDTMGEMLDWLKPYADSVWGAVPVDHARAVWFASALGFTQEGEDDYHGEGAVKIVRKALH